MSVQDLYVLGSHIKTEIRTDLYCEPCQKNFVDVDEFSFHQAVHHNYFNCSICNNSFENINDKTEHELYKHYPLKCYNCNESFMCNQLLHKHILILHNCKVCDFCSEKIHPKEQYLEHLSHYHRIKSTLHYSEVNGTYLILDAQDEINFHCKLCNEGYPIEMFYVHFTIIHTLKVRILLNIINKMSIKEYVKSNINELDPNIQISKMLSKKHKKMSLSNVEYDCKKTMLKTRNICNVCNNIYNANMPKEFHDIYCNGRYYCRECELSFNSIEDKQCHIDNSHFVHCPLGCHDLELATKDLKTHCMKVHSIVICKYCGVFVSGVNKWLNNHLEAEHNYRSDPNDYIKNELFSVTIANDVKCSLCDGYLTNFIYDLEKIVLHYSNYHSLCIKNIENLLVKNPLLEMKGIDTSKNDSIMPKIEMEPSQDRKLDEISIERTENENCAGINKSEPKSPSLELMNNNNGILEKSQYQILDDLKALNEVKISHEQSIKENSDENVSSNPIIEQYDMNGYNDINFSEIQCIFSDTSDDAMSDTEPSIQTKKRLNKKNATKMLNFLENSENFKENGAFLLQASFLMTCEVCLNGFEKREKYAKHLEKLHGFKCNSANTLTSKSPEQVGCKDKDTKKPYAANNALQKPSKYVAVVKKVKNPLYLCLVCKTETHSKTSARKHLRIHDFWTSVKCDSLDVGYKCRFCDNLFWTVEKRNRHQVVRHLRANEKEKNYMKCYVCTTVFSSKTCLKRHVRIEHNTSQTFTTIAYKCLHCCKLYPNLSDVRAHFENDHPNSKSLYCSLAKCRTKCSSKKVLKSHYKRLHTESRQYPQNCELCDKSLKSFHSMQLHMKMKHGQHKPGFKCRACEHRFDSDLERKAHMQTEHPGVPTFFCKFCDKSFLSKSGLNGHIQMHREINLACPHCQKTFTRRDSYLEHLLIHSGPRHKCNICEKEFVQRSNLIRHTRTHTGDKPYFCRFCFKRFADKGACNSHERVHTREEVSACPYCNQTFSKKQKLKYHIRKHTGEDLEKCGVCQKSFTSAYSLKKHMEIHERRTVRCTCECGKTFACEEYLQRHVRVTHENLKRKRPNGTTVFSFYCQICPKGYNTKDKLNDHVMTHSSYQNLKCLICDFISNKKKIITEHLTTVHGIPDNEHDSCYQFPKDYDNFIMNDHHEDQEIGEDDKTALHAELFGQGIEPVNTPS